MERAKMYKSVALSIFWILIMWVVCWFLYEFAMELMTHKSTVSFLAGIGIITAVIIVFFVVMDYQVFKIKRVLKKKDDEPKGESDKKDPDAESGKKE